MELKFILPSGRVVTLDTFNITQTYGGYIEGVIDRDFNLIILDGFRPPEAKGISYPKDWGQRAHLAIRPSEEEINSRLKPFFISVWLICREPINDPDDDGSELVVTWTTDNPIDQTLQHIIEAGINDIDWNAKDYGL